MCHVMKTKAIAFLLASICFTTLSEKAIAQDTSEVASTVSSEVKKAASDSLQVYKKRGTSGLADAVSECWRVPRDYCLYLDFASHRIAVSAKHAGAPLEQYFNTASVSKRGHTWLKPNGRGQVANDQYLDAVDQVMSRVLLNQRDKMFNGSP